MAISAQTAQVEDALVRRIQQGDDGAFDHLVELCAPRVYNLAFRLVGNAEDAQDIAQEAFVRVYQAIPRFKGDAAFSTWLYRIVTNACYDELKRRRRRPSPVSDLAPADDDAPSRDDIDTDGVTTEDIALQHERQQLVQQAVAELPEPFRVVLVLYDFQGFTYEEIAAILKQKVGTIKSRLNRARNLLREKLADKRELFTLPQSQSS